MHDNALTALPKEIGSLQKLVRLNVSHNKLTELPAELFGLGDLRQFNVSHNQMQEVDVKICDLVMLDVLVSSLDNIFEMYFCIWKF